MKHCLKTQLLWKISKKGLSRAVGQGGCSTQRCCEGNVFLKKLPFSKQLHIVYLGIDLLIDFGFLYLFMDTVAKVIVLWIGFYVGVIVLKPSPIWWRGLKLENELWYNKDRRNGSKKGAISSTVLQRSFGINFA